MTPTNKLRFVKRTIKKETPIPGTADYVFSETIEVRVLQQWWTAGPLDALSVQLGTNGEWRDVPLEEEE